jgi:hypothetical protein
MEEIWYDNVERNEKLGWTEDWKYIKRSFFYTLYVPRYGEVKGYSCYEELEV